MSGWNSIADIAKDVESGAVTALSLVEKSLKLIQDNEEYRAIIISLDESALIRAKLIDDRVKKGERIGKLAGVPFIAKDNFLVFGGDTTAASNILKGFKAPYQATAINRLEAEGAICVAKANLDAFAHGSSTENSDFFTTLNPHDKSRVPGGSSGGSAAAVALSMAPFALGTDTGGSIRQPASFCGVFGLKPTYGLVSRSGVVAMGSSLDVVGPITHTVEDAALVLDVISGKDELDMTTVDRDETSYQTLDVPIKGKKIGIIKEYMDDDVEGPVKSVIEAAIEKLAASGAEVSQISLPSTKLSLAVYYILAPAEVSSNLSRYDGQRFGYSKKSAESLDDSYKISRDEGFGTEAKRRIMIGTYVLSSGYYDAYYKKAQIVRSKIINEFDEAFSKYDFLVGPVSPVLPFKIGEKTKDPISMYLSDLFMTSANLTGCSAVSVPAGESEGLPVGLQILAPRLRDRQLLGISKSFMEANK